MYTGTLIYVLTIIHESMLLYRGSTVLPQLMVFGPHGKRGLFAPYLVLVGLKPDSANVIVRLQSMTAYHVMVGTLIVKTVMTILVQSTDSGLSGYHGNHVLRHVVEAHVTGTGRVIIPRLRTAVLIVLTLIMRCHHVLNHRVQVYTCRLLYYAHKTSFIFICKLYLSL